MASTLKMFAVAISVSLAFGGCAGFGPANLEPIVTVTNTAFPPKGDLDLVLMQIERAARFSGWTTEVTDVGEILASRRKGRSQHVAQVLIHFDTRAFSIIYRGSVALDYDGTQIHKLYNRWVRDLETAIVTEMSPHDTLRRNLERANA